MKKLMTLSAVLIMGSALAQTNTNSTTISNTQTKSVLDNAELTLETETATARDDRNDIEGYESYYQIQPGYKVNNKFKVQVGTTYFIREMDGTRAEDESRNKDGLADLYTKLNYKATSYKENGIADIRLQARLYSDQDDFFKRRYASDGNYQIRSYFGMPIAGGVYINKYVSYLRYKNYFNNEYTNDFSRDYELRARVAPSYMLNNGVELGTTLTYNHIFKVNQLNDSEDVDFDLTARYQSGPYAILGRVGFEVMNNQDGQTVLKENEDAGKTFGYALTLTAYL